LTEISYLTKFDTLTYCHDVLVLTLIHSTSIDIEITHRPQCKIDLWHLDFTSVLGIDMLTSG